MTTIKPITSIGLSISPREDFTPPSTGDFITEIINEAKSLEEEDNKYAFFDYKHSEWLKSLTEDERKAYNALRDTEEAAGDAYNPDTDKDDTPTAEAYFAACEARERFEDSHGIHFCYFCSYYYMDGKNKSATCDKILKAVRPSCLACPHFTTGVTEEEKEEIEKEKIYRAAHPLYAKRKERESRERSANNLADRIRRSPKVEFEICGFHSSHLEWVERKYKEFPQVFKDTKYPTFDDFKKEMEAFFASRKTGGKEEPTTGGSET